MSPSSGVEYQGHPSLHFAAPGNKGADLHRTSLVLPKPHEGVAYGLGEAGLGRQDLASEAPPGVHSIHGFLLGSGMSPRERERLEALSQWPGVWELTGCHKLWEGVWGGVLPRPWSP